MGECFVYDAVRTPRGRGNAKGALYATSPVDLVGVVLRALRERNHLDTSLVEDVVLGCVEPVSEQGGNISRIGVLHAGWDTSVPGVTVSRYCASGLEAVNLAAAQVMAGQADLMVGGGVESMSRVPMGSSRGPWATDPQVASGTFFVPQGISADLIATRWGYTRADCDAVALESQRRAAEAWKEGRFSRSVVPVRDRNGVTVLERDEYPRADTTAAGLAKLEPAFAKMGEQYGFDAVALQRYPDVEVIEHVHTAGNSSGIVDGASAVLLGSREAGVRAGLRPRARIRSFASIGSEPCIMLTGPSVAAERALRKAGLTAGDIDVWEINEAFSAVVLRFREALGLDPERVNPNGGAIALGHPLGATGAMILGTALDELERRQARFGLVALCVGAGMGTATVIERLEA